MNSLKDRVAKKENVLKDVITDDVGSLQTINSLLTHHADSKKPSLTTEGHTKHRVQACWEVTETSVINTEIQEGQNKQDKKMMD